MKEEMEQAEVRRSKITSQQFLQAENKSDQEKGKYCETKVDLKVMKLSTVLKKPTDALSDRRINEHPTEPVLRRFNSLHQGDKEDPYLYRKVKKNENQKDVLSRKRKKTFPGTTRAEISEKRLCSIKTDSDINSADFSTNNKPPSIQFLKDISDDTFFFTPTTNFSYSWKALELGSKRGSGAWNRFFQNNTYKHYESSVVDPLAMTPNEILQIIETLNPKKLLLPPKGSLLHQIARDLRTNLSTDEVVKEKKIQHNKVKISLSSGVRLNKFQRTDETVIDNPDPNLVTVKRYDRETGQERIHSKSLLKENELNRFNTSSECYPHEAQIKSQLDVSLHICKMEKSPTERIKRKKYSIDSKKYDDLVSFLEDENDLLISCSQLTCRKAIRDNQIVAEKPDILAEAISFEDDINTVHSLSECCAMKKAFKTLSHLYRGMCKQVIDDRAFNRREVKILKPSKLIERFKTMENKICSLELLEDQIIKSGGVIAELVDYKLVNSMLGFLEPMINTKQNERSSQL